MYSINSPVTKRPIDSISDADSAGSAASRNGSNIRRIPPTHEPMDQLGQLNQGQPDQRLSLNDYSVNNCEVVNTLQRELTPTAEAPSYDYPSGAISFKRFKQGVNGARLQLEIGLARDHIQSHMDQHYPGKFALTIPDDNAMKVIAEFVAPFGWWEGAYYKVEFDFSNTDKHNEGPSIKVILAPPVAHLFDGELCLAQAIPHSACPDFWIRKDAAKYSSYNFDRVQQMMNVMNFLIMDTDFWEEGTGRTMNYPDPKIIDLPRIYFNKHHRRNIVKYSGYEGLKHLKCHIAEEIASVNQRAKGSNSSLSFDVDPEIILRKKFDRPEFSLIEPKPYDFPDAGSKGEISERILIYSPEDLSGCVPADPIVIEPSGKWKDQLSVKNQVMMRLERNGKTVITPHKADYFYPIQLYPKGRVAELHTTVKNRFFITYRDPKGKLLSYPPGYNYSGTELGSVSKKTKVEVLQAFTLSELKEVLSMKLRYITSDSNQLTDVYYGQEKIENDDDLNEAITSLKNDIKNKNRNRKHTKRLGVIFIKEPPNEWDWDGYREWKALLKPTKTMAKASNLASQFEITISPETPETAQRYRDGMQWGIVANAWLPVMDKEMQVYEKITVIKQLIDFAHKTLKLPYNRAALTACDANNIIMKSMTMTMVDALRKGKDWLPSQCFLDLLVNAINTHHEISELYADRKYRNLRLMIHAFSGTLARNNLKDFAFLINYLVPAWNQLDNISGQERDALEPRLIINAFIEYLVRVMERESKDPEKYAAQGLDNEAELTLDKIINASQTGFSVVAHQLTLLVYLLRRKDSLSKLTEPEREELQSRIKEIQRFISTSREGQYAQLMQLLLPDESNWIKPVDFASKEHQQTIINTVLEKFHERTREPSPSQASEDSEQPMEVDNNRTIPGKAFAVLDDKEYERLDTRLSKQLAGLKLRKNVEVEEDGFKKYQQSCHYCGDLYLTNKRLHETKTKVKAERIENGFIYRSGMPIHKECKEARQEATRNAFSLIMAMEANYPYVPNKSTKD
ncbi:hypothetical protein J7438_13705 [Thalassotalea sp. G20_0]|uniref:hypothetical protein n=1 Tax=Thalassotalea sp. G20_0 TaxID=2821093 RepID=UPI001ADC078E|nr:hypothetical protein [Thalassotalea sp. G20_0]MBO9495136.1 hypothetical protein [Thalassotalea sp. G20_0]